MAELLESDSDGAPPDIHLSSQAFDISFHPSRDVIATGEVEGTVVVHSYSANDGNRVLLELNNHKKSCRALSFSLDGQYLFTASKDKSLQAVDMDTGSVAHCIRKAHDSPVYCMKVISENLLATGDDDGCVKLWDKRKASSVMELRENEDFISDMACDPEGRTLLAASGDGSLTVLNVRRQKLEDKSDNMENELLSIVVIKGGKKVVCGAGDGTLNIFSWGEWGDISDRFPGHPMSIDACVAISDSIVCTGSIDGLVRAVHILPNKFLGTVGEHEDFPIDRIRLSHDGCIIGSCSHDQRVKFWNITHLREVNLDVAATRETDSQKETSDNFFADL